ncbi:hypothetical protein ACFYZ2_31150 [Streptomyces sviceus]|uniref:hypothetical protein n=1 Tax=Streptomyces sviceus TaxID=285530 RepID=UPI0036CDD758
MPSSTTGRAGLQGPLTVIDTPENTTLVYREGNGNSTLISERDEVGVLARRYASPRNPPP